MKVLGGGSAPRRARASFTTRFAVVLGVLGLLITATTATIPLTQSIDDIRNQALFRSADKADIASNQLVQVQNSLQDFAKQLGDQAVTGLDPTTSDNLVLTTDSLLQHTTTALKGDYVVGVGVGDLTELYNDGEKLVGDGPLAAPLRADVQRGVSVAYDLGTRPWLIETSPFDRKATDQAPAVSGRTFIAQPLRDDTIANIALLVSSGGDTVDVALVRSGRYAVGTTINGRPARDGDPIDPALASVIASDRPSIVTLGGRDVAVAVSPLRGDRGLSLLVLTPVGATASFLSTVAGPTGIIAAVMLVLALLFVYFTVERSLGRPLRRLDRAVSALAHNDFDVPVPLGTDDEIGRLGTTFDAMRQELRATIRGAEARAAIAAELNAAQPLPTALAAVCAQLRGTTGARFALVAVSESSVSDCFAASDGLARKPDAVALLHGDGPLGATLRADGGPVLACALDGTPEARLGMRTLCTAPMRIGQRVLGVVAIADKPSNILPADGDLVVTVAEQVALALERANVLALTQRQAITDEMTGLYNYRFLVDYLDQQIALAERLRAPLSVLMLDLDRFKLLNDEYGHHVGDAALRLFSQTLSHSIRRSDLAARYGGEEFCVVMPNTNREEARLVAEKIRAAVAAIELCPQDGVSAIHFTVSIGGVAYPDDTGSARQLLELADAALYRAKHTGRDRVCFHHDATRRQQRITRVAVAEKPAVAAVLGAKENGSNGHGRNRRRRSAQ